MKLLSTIIATITSSLLIIGGTILVLYFFVWNKSSATTPSPSPSPSSLPNTILIQDITDASDNSIEDLTAFKGIYTQTTDTDKISKIEFTGIFDQVWERVNADGNTKRFLVLYIDDNGMRRWVITGTSFGIKYISDDISELLDPLAFSGGMHYEDLDGELRTITMVDVESVNTSDSFSITDISSETDNSDFSNFLNTTFTPIEYSGDFMGTTEYLVQAWSDKTNYAYFYYKHGGTGILLIGSSPSSWSFTIETNDENGGVFESYTTESNWSDPGETNKYTVKAKSV